MTEHTVADRVVPRCGRGAGSRECIAERWLASRQGGEAVLYGCLAGRSRLASAALPCAFRLPLPTECRELYVAPKWYVIQVTAGSEERMARLISRVVPDGVLQECFCPKFETETKVHGQYVSVTRLLLPGYLIAVTSDPRGVADGLRTLQEFCRVLMQGGAFQPLAKDEVEIIGRLTCTGHRVVPMSLGFKDGDEVVVTEGPLLGHEGRICGIDRRKSVAYLEFDICGRHVRVRIGLAVVSAKGGEEKPGSTEQ